MRLSGEVVITGGCGAIGSNLVRRVLREPEVTRVVVIDDLSGGHEWLLPDDPRVEIVRASIDVIEPEVIHSLVRRAPVFFHLAAHFANDRSWVETYTDTSTNVLGTVNMLDAAVTLNARLFVFASAGCAAGHEDSPYQVSKASGEAYCRCYHHLVPTAVFRFHNSYGPGEVPGPYRNVIPRFFWALMNDKPITIYGDGNDARDFVYVDDVVEDLVHAEPSHKPKELGTGVATTIRDLLFLMQRVTGREPLVQWGRARRWDHRGRVATDQVGRPHMILEEGIRRTWVWFQENEQQIRESARCES